MRRHSHDLKVRMAQYGRAVEELDSLQAELDQGINELGALQTLGGRCCQETLEDLVYRIEVQGVILASLLPQTVLLGGFICCAGRPVVRLHQALRCIISTVAQALGDEDPLVHLLLARTALAGMLDRLCRLRWYREGAAAVQLARLRHRRAVCGYLTRRPGPFPVLQVLDLSSPIDDTDERDAHWLSQRHEPIFAGVAVS